MTDRELLELAARAAGYDFNWRGYAKAHPTIGHGINQVFWNPLTSDCDALRLACLLDLTICCDGRGIYAAKNQQILASSPECKDSERGYYVRRAITRASAEIGKGMV